MNNKSNTTEITAETTETTTEALEQIAGHKPKKYEELELKDDFMFGKVMRNPKLCKELLEKILCVEIEHIDYPETQKSMDVSVDAKSVRLDVYVSDDKHTVYDVEMQTTNKDNLPKRSRYYQGMIDLNLIEKGANYSKLNTSYVIFICTFDFFGKGRHIYTFQERCSEDHAIVLQDEATRVFLNATGTMDDVSKDLHDFLNYLVGKPTDNPWVEEIDNEVKKVRENKEWRREYMTLLMRDQENIKIGITIGEKKGIEKEIFGSVYENDYSAERGAEKLNISKGEFEEKYQNWLKERNKR